MCTNILSDRIDTWEDGSHDIISTSNFVEKAWNQIWDQIPASKKCNAFKQNYVKLSDMMN